MRQLLIAALVLTSLAAAGDKPPAIWEPVPHFRAGAPGRKIDLIVIHTVEGSARSCLATFRGSERLVSAHYLVAKDGTVYQCVKDEDVAWHAGSVNGHSIGIEHEGFALRRDTWTDANYAASARLTRWLCDTYHVPTDRDHIKGHVELPGSPHDDPGPYFDWDRYMRLVRGETAAPSTATQAHAAARAPLPSAPEDGLPPPQLRAGSPRLPAPRRAAPSPQGAAEVASIATSAESAPSQGIAPALEHATRPLLERGSSGESVRDLQRRLNAAFGACVLAEDGIFGPETEKAVRDFQEKNGCKRDGIVGPETWGALLR